MVGKQPRLNRGTADHTTAEADFVGIRQYREGTQVKDFVVEGTQGQPIGFDVRPARLKPLNMCCLKSDHLVVQPNVVAAEAAAVLIGEQYFLTKGRIATPLGCLVIEAYCRDRQADSIQNILLNGLREMGSDKSLGQLRNEARIG